MRKIRLLLGLSLAMMAMSCGRSTETLPVGKYEEGIVVINEGNFSDADGEVSFLGRGTNALVNNIFEAENSRPFAGIIQRGRLHQERIYLVANRADKVEVVDANTFKSIATVSNDLVNPQDFAAVNNKGFISNWGPFSPTFSRDEGFVAVLDLNSNSISRRIPMPAYPQGILAAGGNIFVALEGSNRVAVINPATESISAQIEVPAQPSQLLADNNNRIWVICRSGAIVRINPSNNTVEATISTLPVRPSGRAAYNASTNRLYYHATVNSTGHIYELASNASTAPSAPLFTQASVYGLGYDAKENVIYLSDAKGFQGNGSISRYSIGGTKIDELNAGRGPNGFIFR
jgi:YVTN family beta-propeller protein